MKVNVIELLYEPEKEAKEMKAKNLRRYFKEGYQRVDTKDGVHILKKQAQVWAKIQLPEEGETLKICITRSVDNFMKLHFEGVDKSYENFKQLWDTGSLTLEYHPNNRTCKIKDR